ncbi:head maturation protease, ClpP-related [Cypionkella sinensis]|uniref:Head maturation protease, ClpP-related n=1 Tax=Cypionkella sinensis TaxID=1756043 RepID=A0ABV7IVX6_9RHOB
MKRGTDLIIGGELVLSGYILTDDSASWMWDNANYFSPALVRDALGELGEGQVTVRLCSVGGEVVAGEAIRAILASHPGGTRIIVEGQAASAASLLFMAGTVREMSIGSFLMIHNPSGGAWGEAQTLRKEADNLDKLAAIYATVYAKASGKTQAEMLAIMANETWYSAEEAISEGFADAVSQEGNASAQQPAAVAQMSLAQTQTIMADQRAKFLAHLTAHRSATGVQPARPPAASSGIPAMLATAQEAVMPNPTPAAPAAPTNPSQPLMAAPVDANAIMLAERTRAQDIRAAAQPFMESGRLTEADVTALISDGSDVVTARSRMLTTMAAREPMPNRVAPVPRGQDETETRRMAMEDSLVARLSRAEPSEAARAFMTHSLVEMAAERMGQSRVPGNFAAREQVLMAAFNTTSDFPILFENALNRALAARYNSAMPTYRRIARQRTYQDFRDHSTVRVGDFPTLQAVNPEGGEIQSGNFSESKEKTAVKAYGIMVNFSRQMLVNDSLNGIQQILNDRGAAVARFEESTFYAMALSGANADGPTLLETTRQVFNTTDLTKAAAAAAITIASLGIGRAAIRKHKSLDGNDLDISASILLVGPDKQTEAEQLVAPVLAAQSNNVNPFSGRLEVVTTAKITGNAWYLFADAAEAACFEWGLLDGYSAPRFRIDNPFGVQGTSMSLEHDFGCGAIDWRGGFKNAGA